MSWFGVFRFALPVTAFVGALVVAVWVASTGCGSNGGQGGGALFDVTPLFTLDGGSTDATAGSGTGTGFGVGADAGTGSGTGTGTGGADSSTPPPGVDAGMIVASPGVTITVIPDGTGDAAGLLAAIKGATSAVHMEMYLLTNSTYIAALEEMAAKVDVKVVLNQTFPSGSGTSTNAASEPELAAGGVNVHWAPINTGFSSYTHEKAVIIDPGTANAQVWIMTMNLDTDAPKYNREYLAKDTTAADVNEAEDIFEADYDDTSIVPSGSLVVAPQLKNPTSGNCETALLSLVNSATTSIDMEAEEFDDSGLESDIFNALAAKAMAGVTVHLTLEDSTDASQNSAVTSLQAAGGVVHGYAYAGTSLDIHAKALVADGARAYIGSENFSGGSLGYNRELGVYFTTASEVQKVYTTIQGDFAAGAAYSSQ